MIFAEKFTRYTEKSLNEYDWQDTNSNVFFQPNLNARFFRFVSKAGKTFEFTESRLEETTNSEFWSRSGQSKKLVLEPHFFYRINDCYINPRHGVSFIDDKFLAETKAYTGKKRIFNRKRNKTDNFFELKTSPFKKAKNIDFLIYGFCTSPGMNYCHFNLDIMSGIVPILDKVKAGKIKLLWSGGFSRFQEQLLNIFNIEKEHIIVCDDELVHCNDLVKSSSNFHVYKKSLTISVQEYFSQVIKKTEAERQNLPKSPARILIERSPVTSRRVTVWSGWDDLKDFALKHGFLALDPGTLPLVEQIHLFRNAEIILAQHGAALTNCAYVSPKAKIIELIPEKRLTKLFYCLSKARGADHFIVICESNRMSLGDDLSSFKFNVPVEKLKSLIMAI